MLLCKFALMVDAAETEYRSKTKGFASQLDRRKCLLLSRYYIVYLEHQIDHHQLPQRSGHRRHRLSSNTRKAPSQVRKFAKYPVWINFGVFVT